MVICFPIIKHFEEKEKSCHLLLKKWHIIEEMVRVLKPFYQATVVLQKEDFTLSDLYTTWIYVQAKMEKYIRKKCYTSLSKLLLDAMNKRKIQLIENPAMTCALILDPRFCSELNIQQKASATSKLLCLWERIKNFHHEKAFNASSHVALNDSESSSDDDITIPNTTYMNVYVNKKKQGCIENSNIDSFSSTLDEVHAQIQRFISTQHEITDANIIHFWNCNEKAFPELFELSKVIFAIAPTQAIVERSFSTLSYVFNDYRSQLSQNLLEDILTICLNKDLFEIVNEEDLNEIIEEFKKGSV